MSRGIARLTGVLAGSRVASEAVLRFPPKELLHLNLCNPFHTVSTQQAHLPELEAILSSCNFPQFKWPRPISAGMELCMLPLLGLPYASDGACSPLP